MKTFPLSFLSAFWRFAVALCVSGVLLFTAVRPASSAVGARYLFGVINNQGTHYDDEWARGVRATTLELQWKLYEPAQGVYDTAYIDHMTSSMRSLKTQGWYVQLVPGYHYAPDWAFTAYPNMQYVNQFGEAYLPPATQGDFRVINAVFNPQARVLISLYLARIFTDFDQNDPLLRFDSVRIGGGVQGELRYPPSVWNGHTNSYWGFDVYAQSPALSGIPVQVVGWRPGVDANPGSTGRGQLLVNPGFEATHEFITAPGWSPDDEVALRNTTYNPYSGLQALQVSLGSANRVHQFVRVQPNTAYEFGGWLRSGDGAGVARLFVIQYDAAMNPIGGAPFGKLESDSTAWAERQSALTSGAGTVYFKVELDGDRAGTFYFDELWLKKAGETDLRDREITVPQAFYDWYVQALTDYENWQIAEMRQHYSGQLDILYAGKGARDNQITDALTNDLRGDGWSEGASALYAAAVFDRHVDGLAETQNIALYLTGVEDPPISEADDTSPYPGAWSGAKWIAFLARSRGLKVWGENSGADNSIALALATQRMRDNGYMGLMWGFESELYASPNPNGYATMGDYAAIIAFYASLRGLYIPLVSMGN